MVLGIKSSGRKSQWVVHFHKTWLKVSSLAPCEAQICALFPERATKRSQVESGKEKQFMFSFPLEEPENETYNKTVVQPAAKERKNEKKRKGKFGQSVQRLRITASMQVIDFPLCYFCLNWRVVLFCFSCQDTILDTGIEGKKKTWWADVFSHVCVNSKLRITFTFKWSAAFWNVV